MSKMVCLFRYSICQKRLEQLKIDEDYDVEVSNNKLTVNDLIYLFKSHYKIKNAEILHLLNGYPKDQVVEFYIGEDQEIHLDSYIKYNPIRIFFAEGLLYFSTSSEHVSEELPERLLLVSKLIFFIRDYIHQKRLEQLKIDGDYDVEVSNYKLTVNDLIYLFKSHYKIKNAEILHLLNGYPKDQVVEFYIGENQEIHLDSYIKYNPIRVFFAEGLLYFSSSSEHVSEEFLERYGFMVEDEYIVVKKGQTKNKASNLLKKDEYIVEESSVAEIFSPSINTQKGLIEDLDKAEPEAPNLLHDSFFHKAIKENSIISENIENYVSFYDTLKSIGLKELPFVDHKILFKKGLINLKSFLEKTYQEHIIYNYFFDEQHRQSILKQDTNEINQKLEVFGISLIVPVPGEKVDTNSMTIVEIQESDLPRGFILQVVSAGLKYIKPYQLAYKAKVLVSK
ncbi:MAG TPA: hypothetical protein PLV22_00065 [Candidatus Cloacimonadota bacterium]|nr:hypothetical protein [Candidatus Cloacimonadota bacterium]